MGDRGNVYVHDQYGPKLENGERAGVYLYSHWTGSDLPRVVAKALDRGRDRWDDTTYLTRIIFSEITRGEDPNATTGFGIGTYPSDEGEFVDVDVENQTANGLPFEDYVAQFNGVRSIT